MSSADGAKKEVYICVIHNHVCMYNCICIITVYVLEPLPATYFTVNKITAPNNRLGSHRLPCWRPFWMTPKDSPWFPQLNHSFKSHSRAYGLRQRKHHARCPRTICFSDASGAGATASGAATTASGAGAGTPQSMKIWTCWYFLEGKLQFGNAWMNEATVLHFASVWDDSQFLSSWIHKHWLSNGTKSTLLSNLVTSLQSCNTSQTWKLMEIPEASKNSFTKLISTKLQMVPVWFSC